MYNENEQDVLIENNMVIDKRLPVEEKEVIREIMEQLEPEDRENVAYLSSEGKIYTNRMSIKTSIHNDILKEITDRIAYIGIGAYRSVSSREGYSWVNNKVYLPERGSNLYINPATQGKNKDARSPQYSNDTPYIYTGGTSSTKVEVNAGLQYNTVSNDWSLMLCSSDNEKNPIIFTSKIQTGQEVALKFYCSVDNRVVVSVIGYDKQGKKKQFAIVRDSKGWRKDGTGCTIKRVTNMAQAYNDFNTGSYIKNVKWSQCLIGVSSNKCSLWSLKDGYHFEVYPAHSMVEAVHIDHKHKK